MIKRITRQQLDVSKYNACLQGAVNYRIYAESWYLDTVANMQWDCLVLNDYEAVMPLPFQKKFGIKIICQPLYCQQLGVFYHSKLKDDVFDLFLRKLKYTIVRSYHFNEDNTLDYHLKGEKSTNQIIDLSRSEDIVYDKKTLKNCKSFQNKKVEIHSNQSIDEVIAFKRTNSEHSANLYLLEKLLKTLEHHDRLAIHFAYQGENLGYSCYILSKNRIIYINSASSIKGKKYSVSTGLLNYMISENTNQNLIFDFEGSNIEGISNFFKGFGTTKVYYTKYKNLWI